MKSNCLYRAISLLMLCFLAGCSATTKNASGENIILNAYSNQLVRNNGDKESYATIRGFPFSKFKRNPGLSANPFVVVEVDSTKLHEESGLFLGWMDPYYSETRLKVPAGIRTFKIRGGGWKSVVHTRIGDVTLEANKSYVIMPEATPDGLYLHIAEYDTDNRFRPDEPESIVPGNKITQSIKVGAQ